MKKRNLKAQANIITVVLIILLVIVSLIIVWNLVQPLVERTTERIDVGGLTVDLKIDENTIQLGDVSNITIKRGSGKGNLTALKFVFTNGVSEYVFTNYSVVLNQLETKKYKINLIGNLSGVTGVRVYPLVTTSSGTEIISGKYDSFGSGFS